MNIFISNDDGIDARGIKVLTEIAKEFGKVYLIAPDKGQSAQSHAITIDIPLRAKKQKEEDGVIYYSCSGRPVDCVKLGINGVFKDIKFDLLLSGINHGSNAATNALYSGTVGVAMDGALENIPSIAFSTTTYNPNVDFEPMKPFVRQIIATMLQNPQNKKACWNVNLPEGELKGIKVCRQAYATWSESILERIDPSGKPYYWIQGEFKSADSRPDVDTTALDAGYVSLVPLNIDLSDLEEIKRITPLF